ncbi:hypothetical protein NEUTE1DRAFT_104750 [Neurospora tetrasperma FGSC 2508]|uniref:RING-type domain-containing protein n=1 Tax=Neurospora tetrasperma (strain FGSC 2508 / ATCC MYA-4615 / P0657) TaxID=510951 RepID=F8N2Z9_NEUT8|nr:uncharacterized protein NEUTE1DRAFT_104750 [Neurospora tetrasperma FGSC 2508]EGO51713.1 hypothetical protein NEUTE1DRAFT_104750 [Neurospora tetrasperma FGSC 2508]
MARVFAISPQADINTSESHYGQTHTSIMTSLSLETNNDGIRHIRKETTLWPEVKQYLLSRAKSSRDPSTVIPRPMCALCDEAELDIAGIPATDIDLVRFEAALLPCGHMFCIPCLNEYQDNLPDASPYDAAVYNPVCGRRQLAREYKCPVCRADMHHRKCWCEVGACGLPSSDLLDGGVVESGGQWAPRLLHPGEVTQNEIEALEWVDHNPAVMDKNTRQKLVKLVNAVPTTLPEWKAAVASMDVDEDDDDDNGSSEDEDENDDETDDEDEEDCSSSSDDDAEYPHDIEMVDLTNEVELDCGITHRDKIFKKLSNRPIGIPDDANLNNKTYPIALWNQVVDPVCYKCRCDILRRYDRAELPLFEIMPVSLRPRLQRIEEEEEEEEETYPRAR